MNMLTPRSTVAFFLLSMLGSTAGAAENFVDVGKSEFNAACASCHGLSGMGDGPLADQLKKRVPNITGLTAGNNGVFPFDRIYQIIDGRQEIKAHGPREMPVWGHAFRQQSSVHFSNYPAHDSESAARSRIMALTEYVYRLQRKDSSLQQSVMPR